ncbi:hypothetical protein [Allofustis seminis]|uniref:hypothetical protein n=1 Tax=Allofustis seminis TaxID=166939 RepID=UPI00036F3D9C|nr:hypothetical protein [Allofustis seminis]
MNTFDTLKYDAQGAAIQSKEERFDASNNKVVRVTLDNGVIFVYTETNKGFENIDTNYALEKQANGYYVSLLDETKKDFNDYF